ncbi:MAG: beta-glucosidase, partial [Clostridiales bacterium]|nr:beta-glucosidase [Clostridiales bacterium]
MIQLLVNLLTPVFTSMGVSESDVEYYANSLSGYVYAIVILFVVAIVVMVAAHWLVKKGTRHVVRWSAGVAWVLCVTIIANVICFGPMYNNISLLLNSSASVSEESVAASKE